MQAPALLLKSSNKTVPGLSTDLSAAFTHLLTEAAIFESVTAASEQDEDEDEDGVNCHYDSTSTISEDE
jgi:hypothetical protein